MLCNYDQKKKLHIFYLYFLNMNISLIVPLKFLKFSIHVCETQMEGRVSQILIKILVFILLYVEDGTLQKNRKIMKVTRFLS